MHALWAIVKKDLLLLLRDRGACFFAFVFPVLFAIFFGTVFGGRGDQAGAGKGGLEVALVDLDQSESSKALGRLLEQNEDIALSTAATAEQARAIVLKRDALAYVVIPAGYGEKQERLFSTGKGGEIELGIDPSRQAETGWLQGILQQAAFRQMSDTMSEPQNLKKQLDTARAALRGTSGENQRLMNQMFTSLDAFSTSLQAARQVQAEGTEPKAVGTAFTPVTIKTTKLSAARGITINAYAISFPQGIIWGIMGCAMGFAASLAAERTKGTFMRLCVAPQSPRKVLLAKGLATGIVTLAVIVAMMALGVGIFGIVIPSYATLAVSVAAVTFAFVGIMMFAATVGRTEAATSRAGWAIMMVMAMLGGAAVPLFVMPDIVQKLSHISPVRWAILALEGAIWRGWGVGDMLLPLGVLVAIGLVGGWAGFVLISRETRPA